MPHPRIFNFNSLISWVRSFHRGSTVPAKHFLRITYLQIWPPMTYVEVKCHITVYCGLITAVADLPSQASLRAALSGDLYVPRTCRKFRDRAFAIAAPRVWHSLPTDIKLHRSTTTSFKRCLKTVLFNRAFAEYVNDSVMRFRSFTRKRNINTLVTVTVTAEIVV